MRRQILRHFQAPTGLLVLTTLLLSGGWTASFGRTPQAQPEDPQTGDSDADSWNVDEPPGDWQTITIDTRETTWSSVDVSPDGERFLVIIGPVRVVLSATW